MTDYQYNLVLLASFTVVAIFSSWLVWRLLDFICHFKDCDSK